MLHVPEAVLKHALEFMSESIQEWTKKILWKTAFKKFQRIWSGIYLYLSISISISICLSIYISISIFR